MAFNERHYVYKKGRENSKLTAMNVRRLYPFSLLIMVDWKQGRSLVFRDFSSVVR
jgi:hypothetical protein